MAGTLKTINRAFTAIHIVPIIQQAFPTSVCSLKTRTKIIPPRFPNAPTRPDMKPYG